MSKTSFSILSKFKEVFSLIPGKLSYAFKQLFPCFPLIGKEEVLER